MVSRWELYRQQCYSYKFELWLMTPFLLDFLVVHPSTSFSLPASFPPHFFILSPAIEACIYHQIKALVNPSLEVEVINWEWVKFVHVIINRIFCGWVWAPMLVYAVWWLPLYSSWFYKPSRRVHMFGQLSLKASHTRSPEIYKCIKTTWPETWLELSLLRALT